MGKMFFLYLALLTVCCRRVQDRTETRYSTDLHPILTCQGHLSTASSNSVRLAASRLMRKVAHQLGDVPSQPSQGNKRYKPPRKRSRVWDKDTCALLRANDMDNPLARFLSPPFPSADDFGHMFPASIAQASEISVNVVSDKTWSEFIHAHPKTVMQSPVVQHAAGSKCKSELKDPGDDQKSQEGRTECANGSNCKSNDSAISGRTSFAVNQFASSFSALVNRPQPVQKTEISQCKSEPMEASDPLNAPKEERSIRGNGSPREAKAVGNGLQPSPEFRPLKRLPEKACVNSPELPTISGPTAAVQSGDRHPDQDPSDATHGRHVPGELNSRLEASPEPGEARERSPGIEGRGNDVTGVGKSPSLYCHVCIRKAKPGAKHVPCSNAGCRKTVCIKCIDIVQGPDKSFVSETFECPHCLRLCEGMTDPKPQCKHYKKAADKRRRKIQQQRTINKARNPRGRNGRTQSAAVRSSLAAPARAQPALAQRVFSQSSNAQPVRAQPVLAQTVLVQTVLAQPVLAQPVLAQPVLAQPVLAQPVQSQHVLVQPVIAHPVITQPVLAQPVLSQPALVQPCHAEPAPPQLAYCQTATLQPPESHLLARQSTVALGAPLHPQSAELQHILTDESAMAVTADHSNVIDAAIAAIEASHGYLGDEDPSPVHSAPASGSITPMQVFSELVLQQPVTQPIDVIAEAIDGAIDNTIDDAIGDAMCDDANPDPIDLSPVYQRFMMIL